MQSSDSIPRYPTAVAVLHWAIALAVIFLVVLGWWMQAIPKEPVGVRAGAYNLHKSIGLVALLLMFARLAWRATHRTPALPPLPVWQRRAALGVHYLLYAAMFADAFSGYLGSATSGYPVKFFGWALPDWAGAHPAVKDACSVIHLVTSWLLLGAILVHIGATLYHEWVLRDRLLWRMWPWTRGTPRQASQARSLG
jgi:cytochrome b561